jgi:nucleotidyltransferase/DNA polymerase involved in DNA repair
METLWIIIALIVGVYLGWRLNDALTKITFKTMIEEAGLTNKDLDKFLEHHGKHLDMDLDQSTDGLEPLEVVLEQHGDQIYAYRKSDDTFLAQGHNREELVEHLKQRLSNVKLIIAQEDGADLIQNG